MLKEPKQRNTIQKAIQHQNRIKFHAQTSIDGKVAEQQKNEFLRWVGSILPTDKAQIFKTLFQPPYETNELCGVVFDKLSNIFNGRNPAFNYQFKSTESKDDWEWYRQEKLGEPNVWGTVGWENFKTEINSIIIVDLPEVQESDLPEPYFYFLPISNVIDYRISDTQKGLFEWIMFRIFNDDDPEDKRIAVYDSGKYRVFREKDGEITDVLIEAPHDLGYCPARFFWNVPMSIDEPDVKMHPITNQLARLDWYNFYSTSKKHLDLYASYPIYSGYEVLCEYSDTARGEKCEKGFLQSITSGLFLRNDGALQKCPMCSEQQLMGAGSYVKKPFPDDQNNISDIGDPVSIVSIDRSALDYNVDEDVRLRNAIIDSICGASSELATSEAINQRQVAATFESRNTVLNRIKKGFEEAQEWTDSAIAALRYGDDFLSLSINYGTDFFNLSAEELRKQYADAKVSGASEAELDAIRSSIIEAKFQNDPIQLQRMLILADIEPYRGFSRSEMLNLRSQGLVSDVEFIIKMNFASYISRFERENMNIIEYHAGDDYPVRINQINEILKKYANEHLQSKG